MNHSLPGHAFSCFVTGTDTEIGKTLVASANYDNMFDWWNGDNVKVVLNEGISDVGGNNCDVDNQYIATITNNSQWDGMGAIAVGILLVVIAVILAIEMSSMLVGESALSEDLEHIEKALQSASIVQSVIHLRTLYVGPDELMVACKVGVDSEQSGASLSAGIDEAEHLIRAQVPHARYIFIEPDILKTS